MKKAISLIVCAVLLLSLSACGDPKDVESVIDSITTTTAVTTTLASDTEVTDGTTADTTELPTTGTEAPAIPTQTTKLTSPGKSTSTTTAGKTSKATSAATTVTVPVTTTKSTKPAPPPTLPPTTTTKPAPTQAGQVVTTTTVKTFDYAYATNQVHTPLPAEQYYYYSLLDAKWQAIYRNIDKAVRNLEEKLYIGADITEEHWSQIYHLYKMDHPELIYLADRIGVSFSGNGEYELLFYYSVGNGEGESSGNNVGELTDGLRQKIREKQARFDKAVNDFISTIPATAPDVVKERMIYDKLLLSSKYNLQAAFGNPDAVGGVWQGLANDNWSAYGVLINHTGVCESYSEAFQTLCNAVGINCTGIVGEAGGGHKWNAVKLDGEWYMADVTFDDPIGGDPDEAYHHYFNLTSAQFKQHNHKWESSGWDGFFRTLKVPDCKGTKYSWDNFVLQYGE